MPGKPYQSKLEPYYELIRSMRLARKTWLEIAEEITRQGCKTAPDGVHHYFKRRIVRKNPLGFPEETPSKPVPVAPPPVVESNRDVTWTTYDPDQPLVLKKKKENENS